MKIVASLILATATSAVFAQTTQTVPIIGGSVTITIPAPIPGPPGPTGAQGPIGPQGPPGPTSSSSSSSSGASSSSGSSSSSSGSSSSSSSSSGGGASPSGTVVTTVGPTLTDAAGHSWAISAGQQIVQNGAVLAGTANVIAIAYVNGMLWQENASCNWYNFSGTLSPALAGLKGLPACPPVASSSSSSSGGSSSSSGGGSGFGIKVVGKTLVNTKTGAAVQLRGVNMSGLELSSILGSGDPWGYGGFGTSSGNIPNDAFVIAKKCNVVRLPLNEESWLHYANSSGKNPDPSGNYVAVVQKSVAQYTADGLFVIVDLHWSSPTAGAIASQQQQMADTAYSLTFWTSLANAFKGNPAVIFELYNEPHDISNAVVDGGGGGWAGYQQMLSAVRATGATNVVLMGGVAWSNDETWWTSNRPIDTLVPAQIAAAHHDYNQGLGYDIGSNAGAAVAMLNATNVPVVITEVGDSNSGSSYISSVLGVADQQGYGVVGWALNPANGFGAPNLTQSWDNNTPSNTTLDTSGAYFFNWTSKHS